MPSPRLCTFRRDWAYTGHDKNPLPCFPTALFTRRKRRIVKPSHALKRAIEGEKPKWARMKQARRPPTNYARAKGVGTERPHGRTHEWPDGDKPDVFGEISARE